jgi:hypothetical protein
VKIDLVGFVHRTARGTVKAAGTVCVGTVLVAKAAVAGGKEGYDDVKAMTAKPEETE